MVNFFFDDNGFQGTFVYKATFSLSEWKKIPAINILLVGNQTVLFKYKLLPSHGAFLLTIKYFGYKGGVQLNNSPLVVEQNNYEPKTVNTCVVYDLDNWPIIPLDNFTFKNCLFGATNNVKTSDKSKYVYSVYGRESDRLGSWS